MPEFILPAEADHCPHCGEVLHEPPNCCEAMKGEHAAETARHLCPDCEGYGLLDEDTNRPTSEGLQCPRCRGFGTLENPLPEDLHGEPRKDGGR
jgi:DnaJ-class molecular chaperone